jgi:hypothetical protein
LNISAEVTRVHLIPFLHPPHPNTESCSATSSAGLLNLSFQKENDSSQEFQGLGNWLFFEVELFSFSGFLYVHALGFCFVLFCFVFWWH